MILLVTLFITSQLFQHTCSEWVEISQQHYRRKPEDFFETVTRKPAVTKADTSAAIITPVLDFDEEDGARVKGAILSVSNAVSDSRLKKGNIYKITNVGLTEKSHQDVTNFKDEISDQLNFSSEVKKPTSVSDFRKGEIEKTTVVGLRKPPKSSTGQRKSNPVSYNRFSYKGHVSLSPGGNKVVRLTTNKNSHANNVQTSTNVGVKNGENIKALSNAKNQKRKPTQDLSGQRYESYEIKEEDNNKYVLKTKGAQENSASNVKTNDKVVLHNLDDVVPQLTTQRPLIPTTASLDVFNVQTEDYPYIDVIHDFDEIPNRRVDLIDSDTYTLEADEISDVKLIVRKTPPKNKQENSRIVTKQPPLTADLNTQDTFSKNQYDVDKNENSKPTNENSDQQSSSEIKNEKIPFERLDVTKIAEPPDPGFVTKHDILEEGFIIDDIQSGNTGQEGSEAMDSEAFKDDVTVTTEKTDYEPVQDDGTSINSTKLNPIENVIKVVKFVTETITKNTRKGFKSKINYLNKLKNTLMNNIVTKIEALWPDDDDARSHRKTRQARGHVEFPSSEGALMSISFLTFAVFLIKLVMQLIQTFRNNNPQFVAPAGAVLVGRAASAISKRAGRLTGN